MSGAHPFQRKSNAEKWSHFSALLYLVKWGLPPAILLLAFGLRLYGLGHKGLWGDEIFQVRQALRPLAAILTRSETPELYDDFFLQFVLLHFVGLVGTNEFWMRLPSVLFSVLALPVTFLLGRAWFGRTAGMVAMLLMAVAPFQIWYAQETRMYAAETFYTALSFYCFSSFRKRPGVWLWAGLTLANTLGLYNHLFTIFPILIEAGTAIVLLALEVRREQKFSARALITTKGALILCSMVCTLSLTLPLVLGLLPDVGLQVGGGGTATPKVDWAFVRDLLIFYSLGADWSWRVLVSAGLALVGLVVLVRRSLESLWIVFVFVVPLGVLAVIPLAGNLAHRYFIFMQPLYLTLIAGGAVLGAQWVVKYMKRNSERTVWMFFGAVVLGLALLGVMVVPPLLALYPRAKLNDWRSEVNYIEQHAAAADLIVIENAAYGARAYHWYAPDANVRLSRLADLVKAQQAKQRVWYISFGGFFDAASDAWVRQNLMPLPSTEWQQQDLVYTATDGFVFPQGESGTRVWVSGW